MTGSGPHRWVLRGGTVVDARDGTRRPNTDVVIDGGLIEAVLDAGSVTGVPVVDVTGRCVVPGFNDMHAHPLELADPRGSLRLMLAHGITGYRQMSGSDRLLRARTAGTLPSGDDVPALLALPGALLTPLNASTPEQVARTVREQHAAGADFVKVALVGPEVFFAAQEQARRLGIPIGGHLPPGIDVVRASAAGLASIEHLGPGTGLLAPCSGHDEQLRAAAGARPAPRFPSFRIPFAEGLLGPVLRRAVINPANRTTPEDARILAEAARTFDHDRARRVADRFARDGTWNVPTLVRELSTYRCDDTDLARSPDLRYVAPAALTSWRKAVARFAALPPATRAAFRAAYDRLLELTALFDQAGAPMLTGSDVCGAVWLVPGPSLHREFDELARSGLSPQRVLRMATADAADFLGIADRAGAVTAGRRADLVVLDGDPLADVRALHAVDGVVRAGTYYGRADLDAMKDRVAGQRSAG